jgi:inosine-uridine nucleoside N-ribohydrolase
MAERKITVIGSINMDLVTSTGRIPKVGETLLGHSFHTIPGGKGANQAVAAARLGADVTMIGAVGDDSRSKGTETAHFFADMTSFYMQSYETFHPGIGGCALHDPLAVGVVIDPGFVKREEWHVKVVLEGEEYGRTVADSEGGPKIQVCTEVDEEKFLKHFLKRIL